LKWINAENELGFNMEDGSAQVIWRCQYRRTSQIKTYLKAAFDRRSTGMPFEARKDLEVLFECRPYELGWLLYAFAGRTGQRLASFSAGQGCEALALSASLQK
jgi:hypothetical protein